ncbi:MAG: hypothetical protein E7207_04745 [Clostridium butyricum]|nr:hypothetical protein [Clostridium butyricum]
MKIGIMQPYLFPYIGYFQLIKSVDKFVVCDDVQYIKQGWINRNRILINGQPKLFVFSLKKGHQALKINERYFGSNFKSEKDKFLKTIKYSYKRAPYYNKVISLLLDILNCDIDIDISKYICNSLKILCGVFNINTKFLISSQITKDNKLKCQDKVIDIVKKLDGDVYINSIGGKKLYSKENFKNNNIDLFFVKNNNIRYKQYEDEFVPNLSIIDVMMFNSIEKIKGMLNEYILE